MHLTTQKKVFQRKEVQGERSCQSAFSCLRRVRPGFEKQPPHKWSARFLLSRIDKGICAGSLVCWHYQTRRIAGRRERRVLYQVILEDEKEKRKTVHSFSPADLGDGDNNHVLCLSDTGTPISISLEGHLTDPNENASRYKRFRNCF